MNRILLQLFAVGIIFAVGHTLTCYDCKIGFFHLCATSKVTCSPGQHCYSGVGKAASVIQISSKGCINAADCNKTKDVDIPGKIGNSSTIYSMTKTCCNTDLCNAAPGMPAAPGLALALASITAVFLALV